MKTSTRSIRKAFWFFLGIFFLLEGCQEAPRIIHKKIDPPLCSMPHPVVPSVKKERDVEKPSFFNKKISLSLSGKVPIQEALFELSKQVGVNIMLDGVFEEKVPILYHAKDQTFEEVLEVLCASAQLRYRFEYGVLHIAQDTPYLQTHIVQFLLGTRKSSTQTSIHTDVLTSGLNKTDSHHDNGASLILNANHTVDFWEELERNVNLLLKDNAEPVNYSLNRYAGILSVIGTQRQQKRIEKYLKKLQRLVTAQILIEAKIIEIDLHDEYKSGINWSGFLSGNGLNPIAMASTAANKVSLDRGQFSFQFASNHLQGFVQFMEQFGCVRTLANPRQTVLNNQSAVLKVAHNEVFFEVQVQDDAGLKGAGAFNYVQQRAQSRVQTVPIGLILYVHPSYNSETGDIIVSIHPTISRVMGMKSDPIVSLYGTREVVSEVPIVQVREMDSIIVAKEGQVIVTGGLMEERFSQTTVGVPGFSQVPLLGELFKNVERKRQTTELVILLKLSVVE